MKYKISVEETVKFNHEMIVEISEDIDIDDLLDSVEDSIEDLDDLGYKLKKLGAISIVSIEDGSGEPGEFEITDCNEYNEED